jgi:hypothetical protein
MQFISLTSCDYLRGKAFDNSQHLFCRLRAKGLHGRLPFRGDSQVSYVRTIAECYLINMFENVETWHAASLRCIELQIYIKILIQCKPLKSTILYIHNPN